MATHGLLLLPAQAQAHLPLLLHQALPPNIPLSATTSPRVPKHAPTPVYKTARQAALGDLAEKHAILR